jgi:hypothetical protein
LRREYLFFNDLRGIATRKKKAQRHLVINEGKKQKHRKFFDWRNKGSIKSISKRNSLTPAM